MPSHCPQTVSVWGSGGRIELTVAKFMALQRTVQPDWYQSMADGETRQNNTSRKRVRKSVDRTLTHLDECLLVHQKTQVHTHNQQSQHTHHHSVTFVNQSCTARACEAGIDVGCSCCHRGPLCCCDMAEKTVRLGGMHNQWVHLLLVAV